MKETIQIDRAGRVVLPKQLRENFRLKSGDKLVISVRGDAIELRPARTTVRLERVNGVLVLTGDTALPAGRDFVQEAREDRIQGMVSGQPIRS